MQVCVTNNFLVELPNVRHRTTGVRIKTVVEFLSLRDIATQFSEVVGEKASLALELTKEQFEASRYADHPAAELMYLSWEFVARAGPDSGYRVSWLLNHFRFASSLIITRTRVSLFLSIQLQRPIRSG